MDRDEQDDLVRRIVSLFDDEVRPPKVVDRRYQPSYGYRAVHLIVFPASVPVEIQVRTRLQHEWANLFEKLADRIGRGIRYGEEPARWLSREEVEALGPHDKQEYEMAYQSRCRVLEMVGDLADKTAEIEMTESARPDSNALLRRRKSAIEVLKSFSDEIDDLLLFS